MKVVPYSAEWQDRALAFRQRVYPDNPWGHRSAHFRWRFLENPLASEPIYLLAVEGETILGQWAGLADRVWHQGRAWDCAWLVDLVVAPEHRDTMAAPALFRAASRLDRVLLAIGAPAFMLNFYRAFHWRRFAVADTFYSVFRPAPLLRLSGNAPAGWKARLLAMAEQAGPLAHQAQARLEARRAAIEPLPAFTDEVTTLFHHLRDRLGVVSERTAQTLTWKFTRRPCGQHRAFAVRHRDGSLRGYGVLKLRHRAGVARWGELADFLVEPGDADAFRALVAHGRLEALRAGADFVRLCCSHSEHTTLLRPPWWMRRVRSPVDDTFAYARDPAALAAVTSRPWTYTAFCSDNVDTGLDEWDDTPLS